MGNLFKKLSFSLFDYLFPKKPTILTAKDKGILSSFDVVIFDCDGVLYHDTYAIGGSDKFVHKLLKSGKKCIFVTNASGNSRKRLYEKLNSLGFNDNSNPFTENDMVTASSAAAEYLVQNYPNCKRTYYVGKIGVYEELTLAGIEVHGKDDKGGLDSLIEQKFYDKGLDVIDSVVVGHIDEDICYERLAKGAVYARNKERPFIATNLDEGWFFEVDNHEVLFPAGGSTVNYLKFAAEREPIVVGKPSKDLAKIIRKKYALENKKILMVGDRLNTDVAFGINGGMSTLLVLSGCHKMKHVNQVTSREKPDFIATCLSDIVDCL